MLMGCDISVKIPNRKPTKAAKLIQNIITIESESKDTFLVLSLYYTKPIICMVLNTATYTCCISACVHQQLLGPYNHSSIQIPMCMGD